MKENFSLCDRLLISNQGLTLKFILYNEIYL